MPYQADAGKQHTSRFIRPPWIANLTGLILLALIVLTIFTWQQSITRKNLQKNSFGRSKMVAGVIKQNIANANASKETVDTLVSSFLLEKAKFIQYLDEVDHLQEHELEALALETGLLGITINRTNTFVSGPNNWYRSNDCTPPFNIIRYDQTTKMGVLSYVDRSSPDLCITIGLDAGPILRLQEKTALPVLFANLATLPGIHYVRLEEKTSGKHVSGKVTLNSANGQVTAESRITTDQGTLVVGLDATNFIQRRNQLRKQFIAFAVLLFTLAFLFSWILFRRQQAEVKRTRDFERMLASERETAALGRATATIAHEVRNPLNAINIGLQRLVMESDNLKDEQHLLIQAMRDAVTRTSNIIGELQRFTKELKPKLESVNPSILLNQQVTLYKPQFEQHGIKLRTEIEETGCIAGDRDLLAEFLENILKNSVEALENGGKVLIRLQRREQQSITLEITNDGFSMDKEEAGRIGEPYFTTKTRGSGLGLALCRRIAESHGWRMVIQPDFEEETFTITLHMQPETLCDKAK